MRKMTTIILAGIMSISMAMTAMADATGTPTVVGEPVEYIGLSDEQQYELNTFLNIFLGKGYYSGGSYYFDIASPDVHWMAALCYDYSCRKMGYRPSGDIEFPDKTYRYYLAYPIEEFNKASEYLFGVTFTDEEIKASYIDASEDGSFYQDCNFYFVAADGEIFSHFAIADTMYIDSNGNHVVDFSIYRKNNISIYDDLSSYYLLSPEEAKDYCNWSILTKVAVGKAVVVPTQYHWRDIYHLKAYFDLRV